MTKKIQLTKGKIAIVDDEDYERINVWSWHTKDQCSTHYARRSFLESGKGKTTTMHRDILRAKKGDIIDHIDGDGLNNRKSNLRFVTKNQNSMNCLPYKNTYSIYKGAHWHKTQNKWHSKIKKDGKNIYIGSFNDEIEAAKAYDLKAKELFGEYAKLNFSDKLWSGYQ